MFTFLQPLVMKSQKGQSEDLPNACFQRGRFGWNLFGYLDVDHRLLKNLVDYKYAGINLKNLNSKDDFFQKYYVDFVNY